MRTAARALNRMFCEFGVDIMRMFWAFRGLPLYVRDLFVVVRQSNRTSDKDFPFAHAYLCLADRFASSGNAAGHYFHQDLLVARRIFLHRPQLHVDVGSRIDGFVAHVASFRALEVFDVRPQSLSVPNVVFRQADLMTFDDDLHDDHCDSLSCLHALEHFGLGRYGDPVCFDGHLVGLRNLSRLLKKGGRFYCSVPIGPQRIEFNAHRVFSVRYLMRLFSDHFVIDRFSYVDDHGDLHEDVPLDADAVMKDFGCEYGCGIFEMTKR